MEHRFSPAGLEIPSAEKAAQILQHRLSSLIDLSLILKHVHWNVVGSGFMAVHELMDAQTESVRGLVDELAERITTLGGVAAGLASQVADMRASEGDYPLGRAPVPAHLGALDKTYDRVAWAHREAIVELDDLDPVSADLVTTQTAALEKNHWFVRAHLENTDGRLSTEDANDALEAATAAVYSPRPAEETDQLQPA